MAASRIPAGHPEGYLEAFATVYKNFALHLLALENGVKIEDPDYPGVNDGVRGIKFIQAAVLSNEKNAAWVKV